MLRRTEPHPFVAKLVASIRQLRAERTTSLAKLTNASDISNGHLSIFRHGLIALTLGTIKRLGRALELSPLLYAFALSDDEKMAEIEKLIRQLPPSCLPLLHQEVLKMLAQED